MRAIRPTCVYLLCIECRTGIVECSIAVFGGGKRSVVCPVLVQSF